MEGCYSILHQSHQAFAQVQIKYELKITIVIAISLKIPAKVQLPAHHCLAKMFEVAFKMFSKLHRQLLR